MYVRDKDERERLKHEVENEINKRTSACKLLLREYDKIVMSDHCSVFASKEKMRRLRLTITDMLKDIEATARELGL